MREILLGFLTPFPARAGMNRRVSFLHYKPHPVPRTRGDEP